MPHDVEFLPSAAKELASLDRRAQERVATEIDRLSLDPHGSGTKPLAGYPALRRSRVGDYRIIYKLEEPQESSAGAKPALPVLVVGRISTRGDVYRRLERLVDQYRRAKQRQEEPPSP